MSSEALCEGGSCAATKIYRIGPSTFFELRRTVFFLAVKDFMFIKNPSIAAQPDEVAQQRRLEAAPGFEPGIKVLQTRALPLGYAATNDSMLSTYKKVNILNVA